MLVLSRKLSESIVIGDDIVVKVVRLHGGKVRLGIEAPEGIRILRFEHLPQEADGSKAERDAACCGV
jgi:carbon storage regulator